MIPALMIFISVILILLKAVLLIEISWIMACIPAIVGIVAWIFASVFVRTHKATRRDVLRAVESVKQERAEKRRLKKEAQAAKKAAKQKEEEEESETPPDDPDDEEEFESTE